MKTTGSQMVIIEKLEGDTLTPISIYQKLKGAKKFLLESSLKHEASGRYSIIGSDPVFELIGNGAKTTIVKAGSTELYEEKALELVKKLLPIHDIDLPFGLPINAGAVGYVGYDNIRQYENIGPEAKDELQLPDVHLLFLKIS